ncbi:MAG: alpha/beta hydrolase [Rhodospirillaceae bacterium]|nr:alpha/beta hydrolase [Rhodospirillaceae bacterium]
MKVGSVLLDENITVLGKGHPVVFIHGVGLDRQMWLPLMYKLENRYQCVACDLLGHGTSNMPPGDVNLKVFSENLLDLIGSFNPQKPTLVGFSMGAMVAQQFALDHPNVINNLILSNAIYKRSKTQRKAALERLEQVSEMGMVAMIEPAIARWFTSHFIAENGWVLDGIRKTLLRNKPLNYLKAYRLFATADEALSDLLENIKCPTCVVTGENDVNSTTSMAYAMAENLKKSKVIVMKGLAHGAPIEAPDDFASIVISAIETS